MSGTESRMQNSLMMQSLLADRFKLKVHFEMRELPVYALVVAKGGPKVKLTKADPNAPPIPKGANYRNAFGPHSGIGVTFGAQGMREMTTTDVSMDDIAQSFQETANDLGGAHGCEQDGPEGAV